MAQVIYLTKNGEQVSFDREPAAVIQTLRNGKYAVTFSREKETRSLDQNSLMWMWFDCISRETGTPQQVVHDYYCTKFLRRQIDWNDNRYTIVEGTSKLSKERMKNFLDNVQADALSEFGIRLPLPEDRYFEQFFETYK